MKITLSKSQWEFIGKKTGWIKAAESNTPIVNSIIEPRNEEEKNNNININRAKFNLLQAKKKSDDSEVLIVTKKEGVSAYTVVGKLSNENKWIEIKPQQINIEDYKISKYL